MNKGDELGVFQFSGSSIIVVFQHRRIEFDDDLLRLSEQKIQTSVEVGMSMGYATRHLQDQSSPSMFLMTVPG